MAGFKERKAYVDNVGSMSGLCKKLCCTSSWAYLTMLSYMYVVTFLQRFWYMRLDKDL
jgi:hypothetical protein